MHPMNCQRSFISALVILLSLSFAYEMILPGAVQCGEWRVTPIRLFLDRGARSGVITVQNGSDAPMTFHVKGMEWIQDADGNDQYLETEDLIYFPKQLVVPANAERVVRVGNKGGMGAREKTYRLFIEEIAPPRSESAAEQTQIAIAIRFAVPLFIRPAKEMLDGEFVAAELDQGNLRSTLKNSGNVHFRIRTIQLSGKDASGAEVFNREINGWYLLAGMSRTYSEEIPPQICQQLQDIEIKILTDQDSFERKIHVDSDMCTAP